MPNLSIAQIQDLMRQAGWPEELIPKGAAIFYDESAKGNPAARNYNPPIEDSIGLAQINRLTWRGYSVETLSNPIYNLKLAYQIYLKQGWKAWGSFTNGRWRKYLDSSQNVYNPKSEAPTQALTVSPGNPQIKKMLIFAAGTILILVALLSLRSA